MKNVFRLMLAIAVSSLVASAYAGGDCCPKTTKTDGKEAKADQCLTMFSKLNLTDEQKTKLASLKEECDKAGCTVESHQKFVKAARTILTAEQLAQCKSICEKDGGACNMSAKEGAAHKH